MAFEGYALNNFKIGRQTTNDTNEKGYMKPDVNTLMEERHCLLSKAEALETKIGVMCHKTHCLFERAQKIDRQIRKLSSGISGIRTSKFNRVFNENGRVPRLWERCGTYYIQIRIQKRHRRLSLHTSSLTAAIPEAENLVRRIKSGELCLYKESGESYILSKGHEPGRENASVNFLNALVAADAIKASDHNNEL
jgi:hypothetical protein